MVAGDPFGLKFLYDVGATYAQVLNFKQFGGSPDGREHILLVFFLLVATQAQI